MKIVLARLHFNKYTNLMKSPTSSFAGFKTLVVPEDVHKELKVLSAQKGVDIRTVTVSALKAYISKQRLVK